MVHRDALYQPHDKDQTLISDLVPVSNQVVKAGEGEGLQVRGKGSVNTGTVVLLDVCGTSQGSKGTWCRSGSLAHAQRDG